MRGFSCTYYYLFKGKYIKEGNEACWAGLNSHYYCDFKKELMKQDKLTNLSYPNLLKYIDTIYISHYKFTETEKYRPLLISIINEITPCYEEKDRIVFKLLETYDQSLILLNFIRNLWSAPHNVPKYIEVFFTTLKTSKAYTDPLERLTYANKVACEANKIEYPPGHSNIHPGSTLVVKNKESLLAYKGCTTQGFLKTK
jgi:hypothetical protein